MIAAFIDIKAFVDIKTRDYQARIKRMEGSILRQISVNLIVIGQGHSGRVIIVPSDMLAFYKQMLYGLLQFTYMTGATVSNFSLEKFVASSTGCDGSFKLKRRKLYVFL